MSESTTITPLVSVPREQYLRKNEGRILEEARTAVASGDPAICNHVIAIDYLTDIFDVHDVSCNRFKDQNPRVSSFHADIRNKAEQLRFYHLSHLAGLVL